MIICIVGQGYVSRKAAEDLLTDYISVYESQGEVVHYLFPSYLTTDGLRNAYQFVKDKENVIRAKRGELLSSFLHHEEEPKILMVLDADTEREFVRSSGRNVSGIYDLSKGLYPVPLADGTLIGSRMPLDGPVSHVDGLEPSPEYDPVARAESVSAALPEPLRGIWDKVIKVGGLSNAQLHEIKEIFMVHVRVSEQDMHPVYINGTGTTPEELNEIIDEELEKIKQEDQVPDKDCIKTVKYWKSKRGNYRKAGNSKPRPGEIEVSLTEDEIEKL